VLKLSYFLFIYFSTTLWAQTEPIRISATFEIFNSENKLISTLSFDGEQKKTFSASAVNPTDLKCEATGRFETATLPKASRDKQQYVHAFIETTCIQGDQKHKAQIGKLLIPLSEFKNFSKTIYLHKPQPKVLLKVKDISSSLN
jgi:hypothetical protein